MFTRSNTKKIKVGNITIGGSDTVIIQSMCNIPSYDYKKIIKQILQLEDAGCELVRITINDEEAARNIDKIKDKIHIPLVADIHFDYHLAIIAMYKGIDKIRINPGNIGDEDKIKLVVSLANTKNIPIRIGVNSGSLEKDILRKYDYRITPEGLFESAKKHVEILERFDFHNIIVSIKSSDVLIAKRAYELFAENYEYPLHIGITESGTLKDGNIKSSLGLGLILNKGIGDTMRVSLTADPVEEIYTAKKILQELKMYNKGYELISCPTCGRTEINIIKISNLLNEELNKLFTNEITNKQNRIYKVACMGCVVNGPGEAKECDIGIAGGKKEAVLFKKGKIIRKIPENEILDVLKEEIILDLSRLK